MKKIYVHSGKGHYVGSGIVVVEESKEEATKLVRSLLDKNGLTDEEVSLEEFKIKKGEVVYLDNGDY
jgi:hypothetical protein